MDSISITRDDFRAATAKALEETMTATKDTGNPVGSLMMSLSNTAFAALVEINLFKMKTKENR